MPHLKLKRTILTNMPLAYSLDDKGDILNLDNLLVVFKWIFSWVILMPIAVIISGTLLAKRFRFDVASRQHFIIPIPKVLRMEATDEEVILGFAGFFITLVIIALSCGQGVYVLFRSQFGIDPGQFNSLCILSSFITVIWSVIIWLTDKARTALPDPSALERDELILRLGKDEGDERSELLRNPSAAERQELILLLEKDKKEKNDE
jgi:hypothetical protein